MVGQDLGFGGSLRLGGFQSPAVVGGGQPVGTIGVAAYGAGASQSSGSLLGTTPGHLQFWAGLGAVVVLLCIRRSLS